MKIIVLEIKNICQLIDYREGHDNFWMIMERARGHPLKEFFERQFQRNFEIPTAIKLTLRLIGIIQQMHGKGVFHQNLSPENIIIEWDPKSSTDDAQLAIVNFSQALILSSRTHASIPSPKDKWYCPPQINHQALNSTVDSSGCCAILFWLLTHINPRHVENNLPHQQARDKLDDMIKTAAKSASMFSYFNFSMIHQENGNFF